ncbi:LysR family transcriptional regulator [Acinetobacter baumannii]|uniref:LysR family transcriptional regulator n=1 Tax=Acinetobacter baumannii TaxID=470 RepID=UPI000F401EC5|nr:LysR family transcriptional regulator [Acinetobacter baumannii]NDM09796.1 LysR family transcriptional regulator [Acinetobacter baumannii]RND08444.1 LysR family transcriptional regulator [Acinetobacter baumannii]
MRSNMLENMNIFVRVVEHGSFTKAADVLQIHRPTVSKVIQQLEDDLGIKLIHRTTRRLKLTEEGEAFYQRARHCLADVNDIMATFSASHTPKGKLRIDAPLSLAHALIIPALAEFQSQYPDVEIIFTASDTKTDLMAEGVDCVIRLGELDDSSFISRRIGEVRMVTCASPNYLKKNGIPQNPDELAKHKVINFFSEHSREVMDWKFVVEGEVLSYRPPTNVLVNNSDVLLSSALAGIGIINVLRASTESYISSGALVEILSDYPSVPKLVSILWPDRQYLPPKVRVFIDWFNELFIRNQKRI